MSGSVISVMDATNLADLYDLPLLDWASIQARLDAGIAQAPDSGGPNRHTCWLTTINPDGSPHVTGVGHSGSTVPSGSRRVSGPARERTSPATHVAR
jgi:hypothetical protein